jgi:hypothetical protein
LARCSRVCQIVSEAENSHTVGSIEDLFFRLKLNAIPDGRIAISFGTLIAQKAEFTDESAREMPPTDGGAWPSEV